MNAETTYFVTGFEDVPGSNATKAPKNQKNQKNQRGGKATEVAHTHLHLIDSANAENNVRFTISQLWSYAEKMPAAFARFQGVGYRAIPRKIFNNFKKAKGFFTGENPVKSVYKKGSNPKVFEGVYVKVISSEEFDALIEEFEEQFCKETDNSKYENDDLEAEQLAVGIDLFRKLLNSEERVKNLMKMFEGVMYGGANSKESLWTVYLGYMKFILCGVAEDYKGKTRNEDGSFDLDYPHLSFTALANAINEAKVNLTAGNTICTEEPFHQRTFSNRSRHGSMHSQRRPSFNRSNSFNSNAPIKKAPHDFASSLKWCLVIGLIEKTFTPALYEKLKATPGKPYAYSAHDIGTIIAPFNIEPLGEVPAKPESKKEKAAKAAAAAKAAKGSSDEEDEPAQPEAAAEDEPEKADSEHDDDEKDDDDDEKDDDDDDDDEEQADEAAVEDSDNDDDDDDEEEEEKTEPAGEAENDDEDEDEDDEDEE